MSTSRRSARPASHRSSDPARPSPRLPTTFGQTPDRATRVGETPTPEPADDRAARLTKAAVDGDRRAPAQLPTAGRNRSGVAQGGLPRLYPLARAAPLVRLPRPPGGGK